MGCPLHIGGTAHSSVVHYPTAGPPVGRTRGRRRPPGAGVVSGPRLPLTGAGVVDLVITDLGVFEIDKKGDGGMTLIELADGVTEDEIRSKTEAAFTVALKG